MKKTQTAIDNLVLARDIFKDCYEKTKVEQYKRWVAWAEGEIQKLK